MSEKEGNKSNKGAAHDQEHLVEGKNRIHQAKTKSSYDDSDESFEAAPSSDLVADDSSSSSSSKGSSLRSTLSDVSELKGQLPTKKGLSKFYQGKSRTFSSLSDARFVEDLAKKEVPFRKRQKDRDTVPFSSLPSPRLLEE